MLGRCESLLIRHTGSDQWCLSLGDDGIASMSLLCWPVKRTTILLPTERLLWQIDGSLAQHKLHMLHIMDEKKFKAVQIFWRSPAYFVMKGISLQDINGSDSGAAVLLGNKLAKWTTC